MYKDYRDNTLDILRGLSIIFVVVLHTMGKYSTVITPYTGVNWWILTVLESIAKIAVPMFVMISGALLLDKAKNYANASEFYKKRLAKIGVPLIFWSVFYYASLILFKLKPLSVKGAIADFLFLDMFYHLYFMYIILGLYMITPFLKVYINNVSIEEIKKTIYSLFTYSITAIIVLHIFPSKLSYWSVFTVFIPFLPYYVAGYYLNSINIQYKVQSLAYLYVAVIILSLPTKFIAWNLANSTQNIWISKYFSDALSINIVLLSILFFILFKQSKNLLLFKNYPWIASHLREIAKYSFGIYLIHPIVIFILNKFITVLSTNIFALLLIGLEILIVLYSSFIIMKISSRIRILKLITGT